MLIEYAPSMQCLLKFARSLLCATIQTFLGVSGTFLAAVFSVEVDSWTLMSLPSYLTRIPFPSGPIFNSDVTWTVHLVEWASPSHLLLIIPLNSCDLHALCRDVRNPSGFFRTDHTFWENALGTELDEASWERINLNIFKGSLNVLTQEYGYKLKTRWYRTPDPIHKFAPVVPDCCWRRGKEW